MRDNSLGTFLLLVLVTRVFEKPPAVAIKRLRGQMNSVDTQSIFDELVKSRGTYSPRIR